MSDENQNNGNGQDESEIAASALDLPINDLEAKAVAREAGLAYVSGQNIKKLCKMGVEADSEALVSTAKGGLLYTIDGLHEVQEKVLGVIREAAKPSVILDGATVYAILAKAQRDCATAVRAEGLAAIQKPQKRKTRTLQILGAPPAQKVG